MRRWKSLPLILGVSVTGSYASFLLLAASHFPHAYGPWRDNTISQLGNRNLNPHGYISYLIGCAIAGVLAMAFFLSLSQWKLDSSRRQRWLFRLVQTLGIVGGLALFMNAIFPENDHLEHHVWAGVLFDAFAAAAIVAIPALWHFGRAILGLIAFNLLAIIAVVLMYAFASIHWVEWLPAGMFLLFPVLLGFLTRQLPGEMTP